MFKTHLNSIGFDSDTSKLKISTKVLKQFENTPGAVKQLAVLLKCDDRTARKYLRNNDLILMAIPCLILIQETTGSTDKKCLKFLPKNRGMSEHEKDIQIVVIGAGEIGKNVYDTLATHGHGNIHVISPDDMERNIRREEKKRKK